MAQNDIRNQARSVRYTNSEGVEIGVKFSRGMDISIVIDNGLDSKQFVFSLEDQQTLDYFEIVFTNLLSYCRSFDVNYGRKSNESKLGLCFNVISEDGKYLEIGANRHIGMVFEIGEMNRSPIRFVFAEEDSMILNLFKKEVFDVIRNNTPKLPPVSTACVEVSA